MAVIARCWTEAQTCAAGIVNDIEEATNHGIRSSSKPHRGMFQCDGQQLHCWQRVLL
jgi:hypothetical protein